MVYAKVNFEITSAQTTASARRFICYATVVPFIGMSNEIRIAISKASDFSALTRGFVLLYS